MRKIIYNGSYLLFRDTPWDSRAFGFKTNEILEIKSDKIKDTQNLLFVFEEKSIEEKIKLSYIRVNANDYEIKKTLSENNFLFIENTYDICHKNLIRTDFIDVSKKFLNIYIPEEKDYLQIMDIANTSFKYGRFHEDYNLCGSIADDRYKNWILDLKKQKKQFFVYKKKDIIISFIAYDIVEDKANLILGGSRIGYEPYSFLFWASFLEKIKGLGVKQVRTRISAANIGIINIYVKLGFYFNKMLSGFHKYYI